MSGEDNRICARVCVEVCGQLASPLLTGSGEEEHTDMDVLTTADGTPFIPGSSLAGCLRDYASRRFGENEAEKLFGFTEKESFTGVNGELERKPGNQSRIFVYDTLLKNAPIIRRNGVRLDEYKTAREQHLFEAQAVDTGAEYRIRLEIVIRSRKEFDKEPEVLWKTDKDIIEACIRGMQRGVLRLGAKTTRGFGRLHVQKAGYRIFFMKKDYGAWLDWDWQKNSVFENGVTLCLSETAESETDGAHYMYVPLKIKNTMLIRRYPVSLPEKGEKLPDYVQMTDRNGRAVIPGSSWAGAVRSYLADLITQITPSLNREQAQNALEPFFGTWSGDNGKRELKASRLIFEESVVDGGHALPLTRNAVDRFTGGSAKGALYEEVVWAEGTVVLTVRWSEYSMMEDGVKETVSCGGMNEKERQNIICGLLLWAVWGLRHGYLTVGGETGVGRGILEAAGECLIDKKPVLNTETCLKAAADWCRGLEKK